MAFAKEEPGALLYVHMDPTAEAKGVDLRVLCDALGIAERGAFPDRHGYFLGYPTELTARHCNAASVLRSASMNKGFCLPITEAQACGMPVTGTDFTSRPELVRWGVTARAFAAYPDQALALLRSSS